MGSGPDEGEVAAGEVGEMGGADWAPPVFREEVPAVDCTPVLGVCSLPEDRMVAAAARGVTERGLVLTFALVFA
jgi:hypothetical protein